MRSQYVTPSAVAPVASMLFDGSAGTPSTSTRTLSVPRAEAADCAPPLLFTVVSVTMPHCSAASNTRSFWLDVLICVLSTSTHPVSPVESGGPDAVCDRSTRLSIATDALAAGIDAAEAAWAELEPDS